MEHDGRFELWHTRLGTRQADGTLREDVERFVRAIWTPNPAIPFLNGLTPADRVDIVRLSSDFSLPQPPLVYGNNPFLIARWRYQLERAGLPRKYVPRPIGARHLMLSGLPTPQTRFQLWRTRASPSQASLLRFRIPPLPRIRLETSFKVQDGTLPRLRFGHNYRLRVRVVDLAGNSPTLDEATALEAALPQLKARLPADDDLIYRRFEPINP